MKILVCGDRNWSDREKLEEILDDLPGLCPWIQWDEIVIIEGGCHGADTFALRWAQKHKLQYKEFPADWDKHGKKAGPIRNREMLNQNPDLVLAFHSNLSKSKGTLDTVMEANRRGIEVRLIP